ncbi:MAG: HAMP domain-containing histidine kinase [Deltaproteobacteria bacterium]|nr:HAMP domain-containing histidine kinase [Deltaproteobacteria bacterium]
MRKLGLLERLIIAYAVFVVVLLGLNIFLLYVSSRLSNVTSEVYLVDYRKNEVTDKLLENLISLEQTTKQYMLLQKDVYKALIDKQIQDVQGAWNYLNSEGVVYDDQEREMLVNAKDIWETFLVQLYSQLSDIPGDSQALDEIFKYNSTQIEKLVRIARYSDNMANEALDKKVVYLKGLGDQLESFTWWAFGIALCIGLIVPLIIYRSIIRDLGSIKKGIKHIADGDFSYEIPITARDELGQLADSFNRMAARLQELDDMKSEFISIVSHELKTPLTSMKEAANILQEGLWGELAEKQKRMISIMDQGIERLLKIIAELLEMSRLEIGMVQLDKAQYDLNHIIASSISEIRPYAANRQIKIQAKLLKDPCMVTVDMNKISQVLTNLIQNAIKYSDAGSLIDVRLGRDGQQVAVEIEDHGKGIPKEDMPLIFEKFYQSKVTRGHSGIGLGLAIAKKIVEAHGGKIYAKSRLDKGSIFVFSLPVML